MLNDPIKLIIARGVDIFKIIIIGYIIILCFNWICLEIITYKTVKEAEKKGYLSYSYYSDLVDSSPLSQTDGDVKIVSSSPKFGKKVNGLGDKIVLELEKEIVLSNILKLNIKTKKIGVNQGFYGDGY